MSGSDPAFPQMCADALDVGMVHAGMSTREIFALAALAGSAWAKKESGLLIDPDLAARRAIEIADAVLARLERQ